MKILNKLNDKFNKKQKMIAIRDPVENLKNNFKKLKEDGKIIDELVNKKVISMNLGVYIKYLSFLDYLILRSSEAITFGDYKEAHRALSSAKYTTLVDIEDLFADKLDKGSCNELYNIAKQRCDNAFNELNKYLK